MELLQTKLQRPRIARSFVPRPRLIERLDQSSQRPLTLVCAGAGYGKTTLVSSWVENLRAGNESTARQPVAWISLDERDSNLDFFLRYLIAGLRTIFPGACAATSGLLQATRKPPFDLLCATLTNELAGLPQDFILVLDDYHLIGNTAVPNLLNELLLHWPQPMHLVLISRHTPAMALASLRAKGQLTEIRARDLRFTLEEAGVYLGQALERPLSQSAIDFLEQRTEGWIAGLQLASLSLRDAQDPENLLQRLSGLDAEFADYLAHDVLSRQPAAIHQFLLRTAILDHFCADLCEAVISNEVPEWSARRCIEWLERHNLFVTALDSRKEWYCYHQLFRDLLLQRAMADFGLSHAADLQRRAAVWFADHGQVEEAVRHALAAGDRELTARFVVQGLCDVLNREDRPTLERWLGLFEDEYAHSRLELLIIRGYSQFLSWQLGALARMLPRAAALLEEETNSTKPGTEPGALRGCLALLSAAMAYFSNDHGVAITCSQEVMALVPEAWMFVRSGSMLFQTLAMQASGQGRAAVKLLIEIYESLSDRASAYARRLMQALCLIYYVEADDLEHVIQTAQQMVVGVEGGKVSLLLQAWGQYFTGLAHYQRNDLVAARQCFTQLLDFKYTGNIGALRDGMQRLALIHQIAGDQAESLAILQLLSQLDLDQMGRETDETCALRARIQLMRGELKNAAQWADGFAAPVPNQPWPWQDPPHLIKARILLARGAAADVQSALEILDAFYEAAERGHNKRLKLEVLALRALALDAAGKADEALDMLRAAVDLAQRGGFLRPFLDLGLRIQEALSELSRKDDMRGNAMLRRILAESGSPSIDAALKMKDVKPSVPAVTVKPAAWLNSDKQSPIEPLSPRELEVLTLLRDPISLKDVAQRLFISYPTAKRHTANIYGKLGVNKRRAAIAKAEDLGLLPPR